jgi:uncharacterized membrane protein YphA (DoxX/SURF4 family)
MELIKKLNKWANSHTYVPVDILRMALGAYLVYKGIYFFRNSQYLESLLIDLNVDGLTALLGTIHIVGLLHFVGGIMIVFGLLTRLTLILHLPIFIGAVVINFFGTMITPNLVQAAIVLIVSLFFIFYGSGKHSADYDLKMEA